MVGTSCARLHVSVTTQCEIRTHLILSTFHYHQQHTRHIYLFRARQLLPQLVSTLFLVSYLDLLIRGQFVEMSSTFSTSTNSMIPRFGEEIPEGSTLVALRRPAEDDAARDSVRLSHCYPTRIKAQGILENFLPASTNIKNWSSIMLEFSIVNIRVAPAIRIAFKFKRKLSTGMDPEKFEKPEHSGWVQFSFGPAFVGSGFPRRVEIGDLKAAWSLDGRTGIVSFNTDGGTSYNLKCLTDFPHGQQDGNFRLTKPELALVEGLSRLTAKTIPEAGRRVTLQLILGEEDSKLRQEGKLVPLDKMFGTLCGPVADVAFRSLAYRFYRNSSGEVATGRNQMLPRAEVLKDGHPGLPFPALSVFRDSEEALVILANGSALLQEEEAVYLRALAARLHKVRLLSIGDKVLAVISLSQPLQVDLWQEMDKVSVVPPFTKVRLDIHIQESPAIFAEGFVTADIFGIDSGANRVLVVIESNENNKDDLSGLATDLKNKGAAQVFDVSVQPVVLEQTAIARMTAITRAYGPETTAYYQKAWPALLNDGSSLPLVDPPSASRNSRSKAIFHMLERPSQRSVLEQGPEGVHR